VVSSGDRCDKDSVKWIVSVAHVRPYTGESQSGSLCQVSKVICQVCEKGDADILTA
jgi:hypothetical protein